MKFWILGIILVGSFALADLDSGHYQGVDSSGLSCEILVGDVSFENGVKHPLNERVSVVVNGQEWSLSHPKVIDEESGKVRFNHSYFEATISTARDGKFGAQYLKMTIDHDAEPHRPKEYIYLNDSYRDSVSSTKIECKSLVKR